MDAKLILSCSVVLVGMLPSCTKDQAYTRDNLLNMDRDMTLFENGVAVPCDTTVTVKLGDIIKTTGQIVCDSKGYYCINARGDVGGAAVKLPDVRLESSLLFSGSGRISTGAYGGQTVSDISVRIATLKDSANLTVSGDIPAEVLEAKSAEVHSDAKVTLKAGSSLCCLGKGFTVKLPKGLTFRKNGISDNYTVAEGPDGRCCITLTKDISVGDGTEFNLLFTHIDVQEGWIKDGGLLVDEPVDFEGDVYARGSGRMPSSFLLSYDGVLSTVAVNSVECRVDLSSTIPARTIEINLPEAFRGDCKVLILNPALVLDIDNESPLPMDASFTVCGYKSGKPCGKTLSVPISIPSQTQTDCIIDEGSCPGFTELLSYMPDKIQISEIKTRSDTEKWVFIKPGDTAKLSAAYRADIPVTLTRGSYINFTQESDAEIEFGDVQVKKVELTLVVGNKIPATLDATLKMTIDGREYEVGTDKPISVGPDSTQEIKATVETSDNVRKVEKVTIAAKASVNDAAASLNREQSVSLQFKSFNFPNGITVR